MGTSNFFVLGEDLYFVIGLKSEDLLLVFGEDRKILFNARDRQLFGGRDPKSSLQDLGGLSQYDTRIARIFIYQPIDWRHFPKCMAMNTFWRPNYSKCK